MRVRTIFATAFVAAAFHPGVYVASSQQSTSPPPDAPTPTMPPAPRSATPPSKDKQKAPPAPQSPAPGATEAPPKKPSTAEDNPFPEDVSNKAATAAKADAHAASAPVANPSVKDPSGSSSLDGLDKLGLDDPSRRQLRLESPDGSGYEYDPKRASQDVKIGQFYLKTGDPKGAYSRFKDATTFDHENAEAVFWLAEAARKLNLPMEAAQNYQVYLEAVPDGPNAKTARRALDQLPKR